MLSCRRARERARPSQCGRTNPASILPISMLAVPVVTTGSLAECAQTWRSRRADRERSSESPRVYGDLRRRGDGQRRSFARSDCAGGTGSSPGDAWRTRSFAWLVKTRERAPLRRTPQCTSTGRQGISSPVSTPRLPSQPQSAQLADRLGKLARSRFHGDELALGPCDIELDDFG